MAKITGLLYQGPHPYTGLSEPSRDYPMPTHDNARSGNAVEFSEMAKHIGCNRVLKGGIRLDGDYRVPTGEHEWWIQ